MWALSKPALWGIALLGVAMVDRHFTVHPVQGGFNLVCFDSPFPDAHGVGAFRDAGMAGAVLDGRCFVETGLIP